MQVTYAESAKQAERARISRELHDAWMTEEIPFLAADHLWERATTIVAGTPDITHDPIGEVVIAPPLPQGKCSAPPTV